MSAISLEDQIKCVRRELALRRRVYPRQVVAGRMKKSNADHEIAAMDAVLETLNRFARLVLMPPGTSVVRVFDLDSKNNPVQRTT